MPLFNLLLQKLKKRKRVKPY